MNAANPKVKTKAGITGINRVAGKPAKTNLPAKGRTCRINHSKISSHGITNRASQDLNNRTGLSSHGITSHVSQDLNSRTDLSRTVITRRVSQDPSSRTNHNNQGMISHAVQDPSA